LRACDYAVLAGIVAAVRAQKFALVDRTAEYKKLAPLLLAPSGPSRDFWRLVSNAPGMGKSTLVHFIGHERWQLENVSQGGVVRADFMKCESQKEAEQALLDAFEKHFGYSMPLLWFSAGTCAAVLHASCACGALSCWDVDLLENCLSGSGARPFRRACVEWVASHVLINAIVSSPELIPRQARAD
jgi:hypothetical protein